MKGRKLCFLEGACMIFHLFVNFMQEKIAMTPETKCVETIVVTIPTVILVIVKKDLFFETRHVGRLLETVSENEHCNVPIGKQLIYGEE